MMDRRTQGDFGRLERCKTMLNEMSHKRELKGKLVYMQMCALILYYFSFEHIPASEVDLKSVVSPY